MIFVVNEKLFFSSSGVVDVRFIKPGQTKNNPFLLHRIVIYNIN